MTHQYPEMWRVLQQVDRFEKHASESSHAAAEVAKTCSAVFDTFLEKAAAEFDADGTPTSEALRACTFAEELYDTRRSLGEKVASEEDADSAMEQLATVVYVDTVLKTASESMSGEEYAQTQHMRLLGREYGVELLKTLVG